MKKLIICLFASLAVIVSGCSEAQKASRQERRAIKAGNALFEQGRYAEAAESYKEAIEKNPNSMEALYNLSLAHLKRAQTVESDSLKQQLTQSALSGFQLVSTSSVSDSELAGKASYNLGNVAFEDRKFPDAINAYKQALRFNPADNDARRNLRIAQLQQQDQNDDNNQDNQDNQENQNDQQNQDQENQDKQNNQQDQDNQDNQQDQNQQAQPQINQQSAEQILQSIENRENQIRARMMQGQEATNNKSSNKRW